MPREEIGEPVGRALIRTAVANGAVQKRFSDWIQVVANLLRTRRPALYAGEYGKRPLGCPTRPVPKPFNPPPFQSSVDVRRTAGCASWLRRVWLEVGSATKTRTLSTIVLFITKRERISESEVHEQNDLAEL